MTCIKYLSVTVGVYLMCITVIVKGHFLSSFASSVVEFFSCMSEECCGDKWIHENFTGLAKQLNSKLYGQNLVVKSVVKHLKGHRKGNSCKALVLSFHGWTGTGKNYVARIIAENMYKKGMSSKYVKLISATKEFPHENKVPEYKLKIGNKWWSQYKWWKKNQGKPGKEPPTHEKLLASFFTYPHWLSLRLKHSQTEDRLRELIESSVKKCEKTMFIFDEMDKMPPELIDTIKPYLDYYEKLDGVDYRKAIFIFLSNTGGVDIAEETLNYWNEGKKREDIKLKDMELIIQKPALNVKSGFWHSELITKHMITAYIPFLPLERKHVKECIRDGLIAGGYYKKRSEIPELKISEILEELTFYPEGVGIFSTTGCKRVVEKIDYVMLEV